MSAAGAAIGSAVPAAVLVAAFLYFALRAATRAPDPDAANKGGKRILGLFLRDYWYWLHGPAERFVLARGISPDALTLAGLGLTGLAGLAYATGFFGLAGWLVVAGGALDILDGKVARKRGLTRPAGAFLDSTLDRYGDWALFTGLAVFYRHQTVIFMAALLALGGSFFVPYVRARAEALGVSCRDGWLQRGERFFFLATTGIFTPILAAAGMPYAAPMAVMLGVLALLGNLTAVMRLLDAYRRLAALPTAAP